VHGLSKIFDGEETYQGEIPSMALLFKNGVFTCGASLVNEHCCLTAAHCKLEITFKYYMSP